MREYRFYDAEKVTWGDGPWLAEPDKVQWIDPETDLDCLAVRNPRMGNWCGYVGIAAGHPAFRQHYDQVDADVHGGLTFSDFCMEGPDAERLVCHVPEPGRPERVWWLGFDCGHFLDLAPAMRARYQNTPELGAAYADYDDPLPVTYRPLAYVMAECEHLAHQLAELTPPRAP